LLVHCRYTDRQAGIVIGNLFSTSGTQVLERVVSFTEARHEILANNIANIDTPGYKTKDLDVKAFQEQLKQVIHSRGSRVDGANRQGEIDYDQYLLFHDRNNRSIEKQMTAITKNSLVHNVAVELLKSRYQLLDRAISLRI